ncbi:HDOD domain-containing protein [Pigmentiphaga soli]|uniref:HDOD domain-containing protein n=1 Tax=Pigmentiphaga soli TaxID=1007095 RepID=A0ABP8H6N0_9BURK
MLPSEPIETTEPTEPKHALTSKLWLRISERGDFPMLSNALRTTISAMKGDDYDFTALVQIVLSDFTLTQRVIRLANSAMYIAFGGNITTVSRALMVLGMEAVGHLVVGMKLVDHFQQSQSQSHRIDAKLELNRAMLAGCVARKLAENRDVLAAEEAVVCTLMRQLGKLLCIFYLESEWQQIRARAQEEGCSDEDACRAVLGISFEELADEAAERWGLPPVIREGMTPFDPRAAIDPAQARSTQWLRAVAGFSTSISQCMTVEDGDSGRRDQRIKESAYLYSKALALGPIALQGVVDVLANENASQHFIREINELRAESARGVDHDTVDAIRCGLSDLQCLPSENQLSQVLTMASETVLASMGFARTVVFVRDADKRSYRAQLGIGADIEPLLSQLTFSAAFSVDVFHLAITNSVGIFIENALDPKFTPHLPDWFRQAMPDAHAFVLLPVRVGNGAAALIYGDWTSTERARKIQPEELNALNDLSLELSRFFRYAAANVAAEL